MRVEIGKYIVIDTEICFGKPTFKGTRIRISDVLKLIASGIRIEEIIRDYYPSLTKEMIQEAIEYASQLVEGERYVEFKIPTR